MLTSEQFKLKYPNAINYSDRLFSTSPFLQHITNPIKLKETGELFTGLICDKTRYDCSYYFYKLGLLHRLDGPAVISYDIRSSKKDIIKSTSWRINQKLVDHHILFEWYDQNGINIDNITPEDEDLILLIVAQDPFLFITA